jgi:hypothetical protein
LFCLKVEEQAENITKYGQIVTDEHKMKAVGVLTRPLSFLTLPPKFIEK